MTQASKKAKYDSAAAATANYYNTTGTVLTAVQLPVDVSYLTTKHPATTICVADTPPECSEHDLVSLFSKYGSAIKAQKILNGRAALVEFSEISSPTRLVHMAKINPFYVGPCRVTLEFSKQNVTGGASKATAEAANDFSLISDKKSKILNLKVSNTEYPITVDVIKAICEVHGKLAKIYIGRMNEEKIVGCLVEYEKEDEAAKAKEQLDGADIYSGCCNLTVTFSKLGKVLVEHNSTDQWDYTLVNKPLLNPAPPEPVQPQPPPQSQYTAPPVTYPPGYNYQNLPQNPYYAQYPGPHNQFYGGSCAPPGMIPPQGPPAQMHMMHPPAPHSYILLPTPAPVHHVTPEGVGIGHATSNLGSESSQRHSDMSVFSMEEGSILLACNLPRSLNCDHLFNILCVYGNIAKIKFLKSKKGFALIQFGTKEAADLVFKHYNNLDISGYCIKFYISHMKELPELSNLGTLEDGSPVMKNYMSEFWFFLTL